MLYVITPLYLHHTDFITCVLYFLLRICRSILHVDYFRPDRSMVLYSLVFIVYQIKQLTSYPSNEWLNHHGFPRLQYIYTYIFVLHS